MASKDKNIFDSINRTDLSSALTSRAISLLAFSSPVGKSPLLVYVEDLEDVPFWKKLFSCIKERYSEIHVTTLKARAIQYKAEVDASGNSLYATGKDALMKVGGLGTNKVIAVDRDYDGLIDKYHVYTEEIRTNKYVISTTYYAIENHIACPNAVNVYLQRMLGDKHDYTKEYCEQLEQYNEVLNLLLPSMLAAYEHSITTATEVEYSIDNLAKDLKCLNDKENMPQYSACKASLASRCDSLHAKYAEEYNLIIHHLTESGKYPIGLWKLVQGHALLAFVECYMHRLVKPAYEIAVNVIKERNADNKRKISVEIKELKKTMFGRYKNATSCISSMMYDNPEIDYSDEGIIKIIDKIKNIS